jgi:hypothetical protein
VENAPCLLPLNGLDALSKKYRYTLMIKINKMMEMNLKYSYKKTLAIKKGDPKIAFFNSPIGITSQ